VITHVIACHNVASQINRGAVLRIEVDRQVHRFDGADAITLCPIVLGNAEVFSSEVPRAGVCRPRWRDRQGAAALRSDGPLVAGTNILAVEVHQVNSTSSDVVFGCTLNLVGGNVAGLTPGLSNSVMTLLPEFPPVWINEVVPNNTIGITDATGEHEPWVELVNMGENPVSLDGWFLTDNYAALNKWALPPGTVIQPRQFLVIFADGQSSDSTAEELHTSFRLNPVSGSVALSRTQLGAPAVVDYADYSGLGANAALASLPDGQGFHRELTTQATPGVVNAASSNHPPVIDPISDHTVLRGTLLAFSVGATDADPGQQRTFSLETPAPAGAAIDSVTGAFTWLSTSADLGTRRFTIRVTDNGTPPLSAAQNFQVVVQEAAAPELGAALSEKDVIVLSWPAQTGVRYRVEYKDSLTESSWRVLSEITGTVPTGSAIDSSLSTRSERYYRLVLP
jgi:hypothetical protein